MQAIYAAGLEPARLARIGQAYYYGARAMEVDGVSDKVSILTPGPVSRVHSACRQPQFPWSRTGGCVPKENVVARN